MDQSAVVQHDGIQRKARLKAADLSEERTAAARGQIERLRDRQRRSGVVEQTPAELRGADGLRHDAEQILRLSGGKVRAEANAQAARQISGDRRNAGAEVGIGERRMRDEHAARLQQVLLLRRAVHAVGHDARLRKQAAAVIGLGIEVRLRAQGLHKGDLTEIFGKMTLHRQAAPGRQLAKPLQQSIAARRDEARRQDRLCMGKARAGQPLLRCGQRGRRIRLAHGLGTVAVHVHLADIADKAAGLQQLHQKGRGGGVHRAEHDGARRGAAAQAVHELAIGQRGIAEIRVFGLLRECAGV